MKNHSICILGLGYIGLPTAAMFAVNDVPVLGVDVNHDVVAKVSKGGVHIAEPGLRTVVAAAVETGKLRVSNDVEPSEVFIIAVPTPITPEKGADLSYLKDAATMIKPHLKEGNMVIVESTIPPGATEEAVIPILEESGLIAGKDFDIVHSPERVIPGKVLVELVENDRVIGGITKKAAERARDLYRAFVRGNIYVTNLVSAELIKLVENSFRDVNIAFANELSRICSVLGTNVWEVREIANHHPRVNILEPGPGVGGHCIAIDPWFIVEKIPQEAKLIRAAREINDSMPHFVVDRVKSLVSPGGKIALWGVTFKADVDDTRESPSTEIINLLKKEDYTLGVYDPYIKQSEFTEMHSLEESIKNADLLVVLVGHSDLKFINPKTVAGLMKTKVILDTKKCLDQKDWQGNGFIFKSL